LSAYRILRADRASSPVEVGATVYRLFGWDYGCAADDTRLLGFDHVAVTLEPDGDYPFFTIPLADLEPIEAPA
jgi:hypothetical protein